MGTPYALQTPEQREKLNAASRAWKARNPDRHKREGSYIKSRFEAAERRALREAESEYLSEVREECLDYTRDLCLMCGVAPKAVRPHGVESYCEGCKRMYNRRYRSPERWSGPIQWLDVAGSRIACDLGSYTPRQTVRGTQRERSLRYTTTSALGLSLYGHQWQQCEYEFCPVPGRWVNPEERHPEEGGTQNPFAATVGHTPAIAFVFRHPEYDGPRVKRLEHWMCNWDAEVWRQATQLWPNL